MLKIRDELRQLEQRVKGKLGRRQQSARRRGIPVRPLAPHGNAAAYRLAQDQRLDPPNASRLENGEPLASKGMKGMSHLSPSQRLVGNLGSSH